MSEADELAAQEKLAEALLAGWPIRVCEWLGDKNAIVICDACDQTWLLSSGFFAQERPGRGVIAVGSDAIRVALLRVMGRAP